MAQWIIVSGGREMRGEDKLSRWSKRLWWSHRLFSAGLWKLPSLRGPNFPGSKYRTLVKLTNKLRFLFHFNLGFLFTLKIQSLTEAGFCFLMSIYCLKSADWSMAGASTVGSPLLQSSYVLEEPNPSHSHLRLSPLIPLSPSLPARVHIQP